MNEYPWNVLATVHFKCASVLWEQLVFLLCVFEVWVSVTGDGVSDVWTVTLVLLH